MEKINEVNPIWERSNIMHKFKYLTKKELSDRIEELKLSFRYFENHCCAGVSGITIGWRQEEDFVEYGMSIRNLVNDQHDRRIAKDNIVRRFDDKQIFRFNFYDGFKDVSKLTPSGEVRNVILIRLFVGLYNSDLLSPKVFGFRKFPDVYLRD